MRSPEHPTRSPEHRAGQKLEAIEEAVRWIREVDGRLLCKSEDPEGPAGWVAIVRTPTASGRKGQVILGFGDSAVSAVTTAQERWEDAWRDLSAVH